MLPPHWELRFWCFLTSEYVAFHDHLLSVLLILLSSVFLLYGVTRRIKLIPPTSSDWLYPLSYLSLGNLLSQITEIKTQILVISHSLKLIQIFPVKQDFVLPSRFLLRQSPNNHHFQPLTFKHILCSDLTYAGFTFSGLFWFHWGNWQELDSALLQWCNVSHTDFYYNFEWHHS